MFLFSECREEDIYRGELEAERVRQRREREAYRQYLSSQTRERREREAAEAKVEEEDRERVLREEGARRKEDARRTAGINMNASHFVLA